MICPTSEKIVKREYWPYDVTYTAISLEDIRVNTKINGHEDKQYSEFFNYKWYK